MKLNSVSCSIPSGELGAGRSLRMLLIDTNIFLEVMLGQIKRKACIEFLTAVRAGRHKAAVTDFTIYSIMIILDGCEKLR